MYSVTYKTKRGSGVLVQTTDHDELVKKIQSCYKQRIKAVAYEDGKEIGRVWKDDSQKPKWNYSIEDEPIV